MKLNEDIVTVLVTEDGNVHRFRGESIPDVCRVAKGPDGTLVLTRRPTTVFVEFVEDASILKHPLKTWIEGFEWLAKKAPGLSMPGFQAFIRACHPSQAKAWDSAESIVDEFTTGRALVHKEDTAALLERYKDEKKRRASVKEGPGKRKEKNEQQDKKTAASRLGHDR